MKIDEIIKDLNKMKIDAVIDNDIELSRYRIYFLLKAIEVKKDYIINNEKYFFESFQYYLEYISINLIKNFNDLNYISYNESKKNILFTIERLNDFEITELIKYSSIINEFYKSFSDETFFEIINEANVIKVEGELISYVKKYIHSEKELHPLFTLYKISMIYYLYCFSYRCLMFLESFNRNEAEVIRYAKIALEYAEEGLKYKPTNYLLYKISYHMGIKLNKKLHLKLNRIDTGLRWQNNFYFYNEGIAKNNKKEFKEAEKLYLEGLNRCLFGTEHRLLHNIALNIQDYLYENNFSNKRMIEISDENARKSIFISRISLDDSINSFNFLHKEENTLEYQCFNILALNRILLNEIDDSLEILTKGIDQIFQIDMKSNTSITFMGDLISNRGIQYMKKGSYEKAKLDFYSCLRYNPSKPDSAYLNISNCYYRKFDYDNMISVLNRLLKQTDIPKIKADAYYNLILAYFMKDDIIKMEEILEKYIEIEDNPEVYNIIGKSYLKNKKHEKAIEAFDLASERGNIDAFYYKALLFLDGNRERAGEYFEKYLNLSKQWIQKRNEEINRSLIPDQIYYKYKAINKYTLQMLIDDYLYFSDINTLNDPFDCRLIYEYNKIPIFKEVFKKEGIPKIMSLSKSNINNVLLWSHYTNNHQGICIGYKFNINELIKNEIILHSIRYVDEIYELENTLLESIKKPYYEFEKFFNTPATKNSLINSIIEKKDNWKYEDEVRLINFNQNKIFSKEAFTIAEIIFGCDTSDEDMITIINILYNKYKKDEDIMVKDNCIYSNKTKLIEFKKLKRSNDVVFSLVVDNDFNIEKYINWYITTTWS